MKLSIKKFRDDLRKRKQERVKVNAAKHRAESKEAWRKKLAALHEGKS